jgi:hypothetical protein
MESITAVFLFVAGKKKTKGKEVEKIDASAKCKDVERVEDTCI